MVVEPTTNYQLTYLTYERLHRLHPYWPLSDLKGMTPRQRTFWLSMGEARRTQKQAEIQRIASEGGTAVAL